MLVVARSTNNTNNPPNKHQVGGDLLDENFLSYYTSQVEMLMLEASNHGICIFGDDDTIKTVPQINILAASPSNPDCVLDVVDCMVHHKQGG